MFGKCGYKAVDDEKLFLNDTDYDEKFKFSGNPPFMLRDYKKQKAALKQAWQNRDFEIDLFWRRSAYFWGFIALIFGAYFGVITSDNFRNAQKMYLDLYIILLGGIFSVAWMLVIKGSKRWQENWEAHIDKLAEDITGPLYKIVYCTNRHFYSVSKINLFLAWVVIVAWIVLFLQYLLNHICKLKRICALPIQKEIFLFFIPVLLLLTGIGIGILLCYGRSKDGGQKVKLKKGEKGKFIDRTEKQ
jgi:hypothetical protein